MSESKNDLLASDDHRQKVLDKLVKLQKASEGEAKIGNAAAAEAFASMINKMLLEYELTPSDVEYHTATEKDPVIEIEVNRDHYGITRKRTRIAWQEALASVVAKAHLCRYLVCRRTNRIWFVGTRSHATVAEYAYGTLVPATNIISRREYVNYEYRCRHDGDKEKSHGFRQAWLTAFVERIDERFKEARAQAVAANPGTALIRLDQAMIKAQAFVDEKYKGKKSPSLSLEADFHWDGYQAGRAAADRMIIDRKGVQGGSAKQIRGEK